MKTRFALLAGCLLLVTPTLALAAEVVIPRGTVVFGELEERITSNENKFRVGYEVDSQLANFRVYINPLISWVWIGTIILFLGTLPPPLELLALVSRLRHWLVPECLR